jgi:S1-C subfamily serine protease
LQPREQDYAFDLGRALDCVVGMASRIPQQAFTAETLGTERSGHGAVIRADGLVLTIGYLIAEAEEIWITLASGRLERGHVLAYDQETGFGLVQILAHVDLPFLTFGRSAGVAPGTRVLLAGHGGRQNCVQAEIVSRQSFTGYWEYHVEDALFTAPAHPTWGGAALIDAKGALLGVGSLQVVQEEDDTERPVNMIVPIDLLTPVLDDLLTLGRRRDPPRPWLGLYAADVDDHVVIVGVSSRGPAKSADLQVGDVILGVEGDLVRDSGHFFRKVWSLGAAGVRVRVTLQREGRRLETLVTSADRARFLRAPRLH